MVATVFRGVIVPLATPFLESGRLDEAALPRLVDHVLAGGVGGVFVAGTTGEAASIAVDDRRRLVELAVQHVDGRARVYVGISGNCLAECLAAADDAARAGVDALVAHLPSYYPLGPAEMRIWFERLAERAPRPLILYNIPVTTRMSIPLETIEALSQHPGIAGIKDSEYDLDRLGALVARTKMREDFAVFVGPSAFAARGLALGAEGLIPGVGNILPGACQRLYECAAVGDREGAERMQALLNRIGDTYQTGRSISQAITALKIGLAALGVCRPFVLPPLQLPGEPERSEIAAVVRAVALELSAELECVNPG